VHEGVAAYFRSGGDVDAAIEGFRGNYLAWAQDRVSGDDRLAPTNIEKILRRWCWAHPLDGLPFVVAPELVEVGAQALLTDEESCLCGHHERVHTGDPLDACTAARCTCGQMTIVIFQGRLDSVPQGRDGRWYVCDVKTTGSITSAWLKGFELASQMSGYCWLVQQTVQKPAVGAFIMAIELGLLPGSTRRCAAHKTPYAECSVAHVKYQLVYTAREPWQLLEWRRGALANARRYVEIQRLVSTIDDIDAVRAEGQWTGACSRCEMFPWCKTGRNPDMARAILVESPWVPFEPLPPQKVEAPA
jgi:hypothetical protein